MLEINRSADQRTYEIISVFFWRRIMLHRNFTAIMGSLFIFTLCLLSLPGCSGPVDPITTPTVTPSSTSANLSTPTDLAATVVTDQPASTTNSAPVVTDQSVSTTKNTAKDITLTGTDADNDALQFSIVSSPSHGTLTSKSNTSTTTTYTYTPVSNYVGSDSFTHKANDSKGDSNTATVNITITDPGSGADAITIDCGNGVLMTLTTIPAGTFRMGDIAGNAGSNEQPVHNVTLSKDYYMGIYEVTQAQWKAAMGTEPWKGQPSIKEQGDCPATYVTWIDAVAFCTKLNQLNPGRTFRLPMEAEWERACRAGTETLYYFGDDSSILGNYAWWDGNAQSVNENYAHVVGTKLKNDYGLFDMHGNVWEWCSDWYGSYSSGSITDPTGPSTESFRVLRGGSWGDSANYCRSSYRGWGAPDYSYYSVGFRIVSGN
ncbi:MAG: SUMF1/EgtB/PvdO family nonheme iron enzyme [Phycisphaerae bacterium]